MSGTAAGGRRWRPKWRRFNRWRRRHWRCRTLILVVIFALPMYETLSGRNLIVRLVGIAIEAIRVDYQPKLRSAEQYSHLCGEKKKLQQAIAGKLDLNLDGVVDADEFAPLRTIGCAPAILQPPAFRADLAILIAANNHLFSDSILSARTLRRAALEHGIEQSRTFFQRENEGIDDILSSACWGFGRLLVWESWRHGLISFNFNLAWMFWSLGRYSATIPWFLLCLFTARMFRHAFAGRWKYMAVGIALIPVAFTCHEAARVDWMTDIYSRTEARWWYVFASICLSLSVILHQLTGASARLAIKRRQFLLRALLSVGALLLFMGVENLGRQWISDVLFQNIAWPYNYLVCLWENLTFGLGDIVSPTTQGRWIPCTLVVAGLISQGFALGVFFRRRGWDDSPRGAG